MIEEKKILSLLQLTIPAETPLTVPGQIKILIMLGIMNSPEMVKSMEMAIEIIPSNTPATLYGLVSLLEKIVKHHPKTTKVHHDEMDKLLKGLDDVPDTTLTYGSFLIICESLMKQIHINRARSHSEKDNKPSEKPAHKSKSKKVAA